MFGSTGDGDDGVLRVRGEALHGAGCGGEGVRDIVEAALVVIELEGEFLHGEGEEKSEEGCGGEAGVKVRGLEELAKGVDGIGEHDGEERGPEAGHVEGPDEIEGHVEEDVEFQETRRGIGAEEAV